MYIQNLFKVKKELIEDLISSKNFINVPENIISDIFIVVLEEIDKSAVSVCQIGQTKVIDEPECKYGFIQYWNSYTMGIEDLEGPLDIIDQETFNDILSKRDKYIDLDNFNKDEYIRQINIGSIIAQRSISKLMEKLNL